jgi:hypothetical protein
MDRRHSKRLLRRTGGRDGEVVADIWADEPIGYGREDVFEGLYVLVWGGGER